VAGWRECEGSKLSVCYREGPWRRQVLTVAWYPVHKSVYGAHVNLVNTEMSICANCGGRNPSLGGKQDTMHNNNLLCQAAMVGLRGLRKNGYWDQFVE